MCYPSAALLLCRVLCAPAAGAAQRSGSPLCALCAGCRGTDPPGAVINLLLRHSLRTHGAGTRAAAAGTLRVRGGRSEAPVADSGGAAEGTAELRSPVKTKKKRMTPVERAKPVADVRDSGRLRVTCLNSATAALALCASLTGSVLAVLMRLSKHVVMAYGLVSGLVYTTLRALAHGVGDVVSLYIDGMVAFQDAGASGSG